ncbi:grpb/dephospho-CoA kinase [Apiospora phragmitis]|uniref:Grpb/dephospho-CoA kinase n=1 Tax=Apiospora phragmitis TaxID=2905665 RepID=A0ABR1UH25_9PEZI
MMPSSSEVTKHHHDANMSAVQMVAGPRNKKPLQIVDPSPAWASTFAALAQQIRDALGDRALAVEHVGSTSVPGLPAKDVIDIDLVVADPGDEPAYVGRLEEEGFVFYFRDLSPGSHQHRFFGRDGPPVWVNLHVYGPDCPEVACHCVFRDWLRANEHDRDLYARTKLDAMAACRGGGETIREYNARKEPVIREILDRAFRANGLLGPGSE